MKKLFISLLFLPVFTFAQTVNPGGVSSNLQLWLKATDGGTSMDTDGELVSAWDDHARTDNAVAETDATSPVFRNNASDNVNYNPVVDFDGTNDGLKYVDDVIYSSGTGSEDGMTWLAVVHPDDASTSKTRQFIFDFGEFAPDGYGMMYGSSHYGVYTSTAYGGAINSDKSHNFSTQPVIANFTIDFSSTQTFSVNGGNPLTTASITLTKLTADEIDQSIPFHIGRQGKDGFIVNNGGRLLDGSIAELIGFNKVLTAAELKQVESYLAVKHGTTLSNAGGGTNGDYVASNGTTTIWDASANSGYHNQVIGIGADANSGLIQKQSHTLDDTTRIYLSSLAATNNANGGSFTNDRSFILAGNNGQAMRNTGSTERPPGLYSRIDREWAIRNTNLSNTETFSMDFKLNTSPITASDLRLLVDDDGDGDFSDASIHASGGTSGITISYDNTNNVVTVSGLSSTLLPSGETTQITLASVNERTPLPADFLTFTALLKAGELTVNWTTASETNSSYFEIEASRDGKHFFKVGEVKSKAQNGNASSSISYHFTKAVTGSAIMGMAFFALALGGFLKNRMRLALILGVCAMAATFYACTKSTDTLAVDKEPLFVRIVQIDKDGGKMHSKIIKTVLQ